ncbi:hypothetical protein F5888DRAFT_1736089 [Russula emetica]|nr:hypothetical protein F5888DRAFT_1736089 [Russula emetica]
MELTHRQNQDTEQSPKLTINNNPNELLVEIFDFYRLDSSFFGWTVKLRWFTLMYVCKRWRTVLFASSSRLDLYFLLLRYTSRGGHMKTILSRHFPPLPIDIDYDRQYGTSLMSKDMGRMLAALKRPDRVRGIHLVASTADFNKSFKATRCSFPTLEVLSLRHRHDEELKIPAGFLKGSNLCLQTLTLHYISLMSISRLLSSSTALTFLSLGINTKSSQLPIMSLLVYLQGIPFLSHLDLEINRFVDDLAHPTRNENFPLSRLTCFRHRGPSAFLSILVAGFSAPSLCNATICLRDASSFSQIPHLLRFIGRLGKDYLIFKVVLNEYYLHLTLLGRKEYVGHRAPCFELNAIRSPQLSIREWIMQMFEMSSAFSVKLSTVEELYIAFQDGADKSEDVLPWRKYLLQFSSLKALRTHGTDFLRIASALHQDQGRSTNLILLPSLEDIELYMASYFTTETQRASELAAFQPFVSARQQAGRPVKISSPEWLGYWPIYWYYQFSQSSVLRGGSSPRVPSLGISCRVSLAMSSAAAAMVV